MSESFSKIQELLRERADYEARLKLLPYDGTPEEAVPHLHMSEYIRTSFISICSGMPVKQGN